MPPAADPPNLVVTEEPLCVEAPLPALTDWITPTERYFVRHHLPVPTLRTEGWKLSLEGLFRTPLSIDWAALQQFAQRSVVVTTECAGNSRYRNYPPAAGVRWRDGAVGTAEWTGVPLGEVLDLAGLGEDARELVLEGADRGREAGVEGEIGYAMSLPVEKARDPDTLLAFAMNGSPLTSDHGAPVRAIVPGWYGMASVKWLTRIRAIPDRFEGYYRSTAYAVLREGDPAHLPGRPVTVLQVKSLVTEPSEGTLLAPGSHRIAGVAWSGHGPIAKVEVGASAPGEEGYDSEWVSAHLVGPRARHAWVRWEAKLTLGTPGYRVLRARATDAAGNTQPRETPWNFRGVETNSIHGVPVIVRDPDR